MGFLERIFGGKSEAPKPEQEFKTPETQKEEQQKEAVKSFEKYSEEELSKMTPEERERFEQNIKNLPPLGDRRPPRTPDMSDK